MSHPPITGVQRSTSYTRATNITGTTIACVARRLEQRDQVEGVDDVDAVPNERDLPPVDDLVADP